MPRILSLVVYGLLALCSFFILPATASDDEIWWDSAINEAKRDGYRLIDTKGLAAALEPGSDTLILDVRADYEFEAGRVPGAANLEFDLGDRMDMSPDKRTAFETLAGADKKRRLVIYCRSFR